jgi:hypothetical protein
MAPACTTASQLRIALSTAASSRRSSPSARSNGTTVQPAPSRTGRVARPTPPDASLDELVGHPAYGRQDLQTDLERFVFLLGGSYGEPLFGPLPH